MNNYFGASTSSTQSGQLFAWDVYVDDFTSPVFISYRSDGVFSLCDVAGASRDTLGLILKCVRG